jgi:hypothetical protein
MLLWEIRERVDKFYMAVDFAEVEEFGQQFHIAKETQSQLFERHRKTVIRAEHTFAADSSGRVGAIGVLMVEFEYKDEW